MEKGYKMFPELFEDFFHHGIKRQAKYLIMTYYFCEMVEAR